MIAMYAALFLSLSTAGSDVAARRAAAVRAARIENAIRAGRGLLPRKAKPPRARDRRVVAPPAPTYLGEPSGVTPTPAEVRSRAVAVPVSAPRPLLVASGVEVEVSLKVRWR
jgi:hypothetical protein